MELMLTIQEFQFLQQYLNEMYQSDTLRSGPMGTLISSLRSKFIILIAHDAIEITEAERGFLLFSLNDTFTTSHSAIVQSQLGSSMKFMRLDTESRITSQVNQNPPNMSGTYQTEWEVMTSIMTKLGKATPSPYKPLKAGPDGDPNGISTPTHHDINDGTGYNHR
jgi:hypothetical protein